MILDSAASSQASTGCSNSWQERLCDGTVSAFAIWTLAVHGAVLVGGNLHQTIAFAGLLLVAGLGYAALRQRRGPSEDRDLGTCPDAAPPSSRLATDRRRFVEQGLALAGFFVVVATGSWLVFWCTCLLLAGSFAALSPRDLPTAGGHVTSRRWHQAVVLLSLVCVLGALCIHRPDLDDAFYIGQAVGIADNPTAPILAEDKIHGISGLPLYLPFYKVESLSVAVAALAYLTPLRALDVSHFLVPALAAFLVPLVYARLYRQLLPRSWLWGVVLTLAFLWCAGDTHRGFGNFSFVRIFQGKAIFLTVLVPLLISHSLTFGRKPSWKRWSRLTTAQIASVGLTTNAVLFAPAIAGLGLLTAIPWREGSLRRLILGVSASSYVLLLSVWMIAAKPEYHSDSKPTPDPLETVKTTLALPAHATPSQDTRGDLSHFDHAANQVLGSGAFTQLLLLVVLGTGVVTTSPLCRRLAVVFPLGFVLILWNPFFAQWTAEVLISPKSYWRVFWTLPLPAMLAIFFTVPLENQTRAPTRLRQLLTVLFAVALFLILPKIYTWSPENNARWAWPAWKVPQRHFPAARMIAQQAPSGTAVLAPMQVAPWIVTQHQPPYPLIVRRVYFRSLEEVFGEEEVERRVVLTRWTQIRRRNRDQLLARAVDEYDLRAICTRLELTQDPEVRMLLGRLGFELVDWTVRYAIWIRPSSDL